jgi:hypothetical protein
VLGVKDVAVGPSDERPGYWTLNCTLDSGHHLVAWWNPLSPSANPERLGVIAPIGPESDGHGVTTEALRSIPLRQITTAMKEAFAQSQAPAEAPSNVGRLGHGDRFYAQVAARYTALVSAGDDSPIATMSRREGLSTETVRARVKRARALGLLVGSRGEPAQLSRRALDILGTDD